MLLYNFTATDINNSNILALIPLLSTYLDNVISNIILLRYNVIINHNRWIVLSRRYHIVPLQPIGPTTMQYLFAQPYQTDERKQGTGDHKTTVEDVCGKVVRGQHVKW